MPDLVLSDIRKDYGAVRAVDRIDMTFAHGELTALLGPSGCGKTTLLRMIAGLEDPSGGTIRLGDADLTGTPAHKRKFGMVFQNFALFPHLNVADNVCYALTISGTPKAKAREKAAELLDLVQLGGYGGRRIGELSGGQRQRVAIARALAQEPDVFLLDEPMSALDAKLREEMQVELRLLQQRLKITTIVVTHDQREAMTMADKIVVMSQGRCEQVGPPQEIYHKPANGFVASFIGRANFMSGRVRDGAVQVAGRMLTVEPAPRYLDGSAVTLALRPEKARLGDFLPEGNRLPAKVTFLRHVGATRDIHLDTPAGALVVEQVSDRGADLKVGSEIEVHLPPDALHLFPAEATAA